ncbi:MAG: hypothetical protein B7Z10_03190 [Rhodobacterales bacterium 32-66-7]|nr:MAG: hypothetical protein B7Z10_03190 [Rhodobacterales bacterium 32-66-7]
MIQGALQHDKTQPVAMQRARGSASLAVARLRGQSRLVDLYQSGSAKVMLPHSHGDAPEAVFLNTSGGLTSGDDLQFAMSVGPGAALTATTQTAERAYLATGGPARMTVRADVAAAARLDWLPQETILFQGAHLLRDTRIDLGTGARLILVEIVVLGRRAMGEVVTHAGLTDRRQVTVNGRPLWFEAQELSPETFSRSGGAAILGSAHVFATLAFCGPGTEAAADALHGQPVPDRVSAAASGWNGRTLLRATATDLWALKLYLGQAVARLTGRPLPRVWQLQGALS